MEQLVSKMDDMVVRGEIPQAVSTFFSEKACTKDVDGSETTTKEEALAKLTGFVNNISNVNEITLLNRSISNNVSMSEFRFHFDMKDGSEINWHEVIRREWKDDKVINETYFQN